MTAPQPYSIRRFRWALAAAACFCSLLTAVWGEPLSSIPNPRTRDGTWVTDLPGALRPETVARLNTSIGDVERSSGIEMAVVVIRSLDGMAVEEAAVKLFELWGIGKKHRDNGLLLLWSTGDRRLRVEVGYGLEGALPDGKVGAILDTYVIPRFKTGDFDRGVIDGVDALLKVARSEPIELVSPRTESYEPGSWSILATVFGSLGGIGAAIGSIVGLRRWRRYRRRSCPQCQTRMLLLGEAEDDAHLEHGQQSEERIGSVDYDVWRCPQCSHHLTLRYPKWLSGYDACPQCHNRTQSSKEEILERATTSGSGTARVTEECAFCSYRQEYTKVIPRIERSDSSRSSGGGGGRGGGSFGGGRSGGGGASRGY